MMKRTLLSAAVAMFVTAGCGGGHDDAGTPAAANAHAMDEYLAAAPAAHGVAARGHVADAKDRAAHRRRRASCRRFRPCYGSRHITGIPDLQIPTLRVTNGPVGVGQNDCVSPDLPGLPLASLSSPASAKATALPSGMAVAASFDTAVASQFGDVIGRESRNLALHVLEGPGMNLARNPHARPQLRVLRRRPDPERHDGRGRDQGDPVARRDRDGEASRRERAGNESHDDQREHRRQDACTNSIWCRSRWP